MALSIINRSTYYRNRSTPFAFELHTYVYRPDGNNSWSWVSIPTYLFVHSEPCGWGPVTGRFRNCFRINDEIDLGHKCILCNVPTGMFGL